MKYWIIPGILDWGFLILAIIMTVVLGEYVWLNPEKPNPQMVLVMGVVIISFIASGSALASNERIKHHRNILKKAGLWTDEEIKKKDLPKD